MKRRILLSIVLLTLVLSLDTSAQKSTGSGSLERSLDQLGQELKQSVAIDYRQWTGARMTYVRLKQRDGCNISLQVSQVPSNPHVNRGNQAPADLSYAEWRVNLTDLDVAQVKIETPVKDYRVIRFATSGGKESIRWKGIGAGDAGLVSRGWLDIGEKHAPQVAAALEQAIIACRK